ncbi:hypothetical protein F2Q68_00008420 [Brassica cretica]|uniref:Serine-threonine/tyrosine-protein kinase catalytic domain-containing protein n=1 Tax=Brassica cretica TaxID=69181 RepID=A0A8S9L4D2_BRACR|nr:hypothetical protein F2Q68_00008420 [Brassica cretica]
MPPMAKTVALEGEVRGLWSTQSTKVKRITKSFAEVVGRGGFGIVYRGTLSDGRMVAVRDVKRGSKRAIIYEFLGNGSLDKFISRKSSVNLDWATLYQIALGVARGLEYLHHGCKTRIVGEDKKKIALKRTCPRSLNSPQSPTLPILRTPTSSSMATIVLHQQPPQAIKTWLNNLRREEQ